MMRINRKMEMQFCTKGTMNVRPPPALVTAFPIRKRVVVQSPTFRCYAAAGKASRVFTRSEKALEINLDPVRYGTLAEIGAGQEVARWFFTVGAAAGTVAKSVSAYDMTISDTVYGHAKRYVTKERLKAMLDYEYLQCQLPLQMSRGDTTAFFAYANTMTTKAYGRRNWCHGWMGVKLQLEPHEAPVEVMLHVEMNNTNTAAIQQNDIGVLGVNLMYACFYRLAPMLKRRDSGRYRKFLTCPLDGIPRERMTIDLMQLNGESFRAAKIDNRVMALRLVEHGLADAALFDANGTPCLPKETLRKRDAIVNRGAFKPFTSVNEDLVKSTIKEMELGCTIGMSDATGIPDKWCQAADHTQSGNGNASPIVLLELNLKELRDASQVMRTGKEKNNPIVRTGEFLARVDTIGAMGYPTLVSSFTENYRLAQFVTGCTEGRVALAFGVYDMQSLFDESAYERLPGGVLEELGRILKSNARIFAYPALAKGGKLITAKTLPLDKFGPQADLLREYLVQTGLLVECSDYNLAQLRHTPLYTGRGSVSATIVKLIGAGHENAWTRLVPKPVAKVIKERGLWGSKVKNGGQKTTFTDEEEEFLGHLNDEISDLESVEDSKSVDPNDIRVNNVNNN